MVPHERSLVKRLAGRPFTLLGINNDRERDRVTTGNAKLGITWRNWWDPKNLISTRWNVRAWPTLYLLDHEGVVRKRWFGNPGDTVIDREVDILVKNAEAAGKER